VNARLLSTIAGACRENETLHFRYQDYAGNPTARTVEPFRLVNTARRWYLVAWDRDREDWRTFRIDRMQPRATTGERFDPRTPPSKDVAAWVTRGIWTSPRCKARVLLLADAESVAARLPFTKGLLEPINADQCYLDIGDTSWEMLAMHLMLLGVDFVANEPRELVDQLARLQDRCGKAIRNASTE
jgi:predicted DNA-binding transcriptional regulator YafY